MKTARKAILLVLCVICLVVASVMGTLAYLTDTEAVNNTFTVGKVDITLDEKDVNEFGDEDGTTRVKENRYNLLPGHDYIKDPIVHVNADSENCFVFVKIENGIAAYEAATVDGGYQNIEKQIADNNWIKLTGVENVYYQNYTKGQDDTNLEVFEHFKLSDTAETVSGWSAITPENTKVIVTAYAIQADGFNGDAAAAWNAGNQSTANGGWVVG